MDKQQLTEMFRQLSDEQVALLTYWAEEAVDIYRKDHAEPTDAIWDAVAELDDVAGAEYERRNLDWDQFFKEDDEDDEAD